MNLTKDNFFELLGVDENATEREIKLAYTKLLRQYPHEQHPEEFQWINKAKDTLLDPEKREKYIRELKNDGAYERLMGEAISYLNQDKPKLGKVAIQELLKKGYGDDPKVLMMAADIARAAKEYNEERIYIRKLEADHADVFEVKCHLRYYYDQIEDFAKAIVYAKQIVDIHPHDNQAFLFLVNLYYANEQLEEMTRLLEQRTAVLDSKIQNYPVFERALFRGIVTDNRVMVKNVVDKLKAIAATDKKKELLDNMVESGSEIPVDAYAFKFFTLLVEELNDREFSYVKDWTDKGKQMFLYDLEYFEMDRSAQNRPQSQSKPRSQPKPLPVYEETTSSAEVKEKSSMRGSILWSIIFGLVFGLAEESLGVGLIVGFVWYFFAGVIKGLMGCLIMIIIVIAILGAIFG